MNKDIFRAIADPTRRTIIDLLANSSRAEYAMTVQEIAAHFAMSRPAVSKHIKILTESGIITIIRSGREHFCILHLEPLREVHEWLAAYESFWQQKLDNLEHFLANPVSQP